jgi:uncharacterized protein (TIGR00290 family)
MKRVAVAWSGGKDSALALYRLKGSKEYKVDALLTTITEGYDRVSMHGVRTALLEEQAESLGIELTRVLIPKDCSNRRYDEEMRGALEELAAGGITAVAFGDLFLEEVRRYREERMEGTGLEPLFPLWGEDTDRLVRSFIDLGFKAILTCVDSKSLDKGFVGRNLDRELLADLPASVDPCGENGEFHTFAYDGPMFQRSIAFDKGEVVLRADRFYFCDLIPRETT